jgi:hypothetical protein
MSTTRAKQTPEAAAFLDLVASLPAGPVDLDPVLMPSLDDEAILRKLFAQDKNNTRLSNPYVGLVDVYAAPDAIRKTRARVATNEDELTGKHIMPLSDETRRKEGEPAISSFDEFERNFKIFTGACTMFFRQMRER